MAAPPVHPQLARRALTRAEVIAMGQAGRLWEFLPLAVLALRQAPADSGLRFLLAANLAQLGLRTLAGEELAGLPREARSDSDVCALAEAVAGLPDDRVTADERRAIALGNLRALRARGFDQGGALTAAFEAWSRGLGGDECFRAVDGNLVRRLGRAGSPGWEQSLIDQRSAAARFCEQLTAKAELTPPPLAVEGLDPPWLFEGAWRALSRNRMGYAAPITILQADPMEFFDGLSVLDLREALVDPRVLVFVGPDASQRWVNDALARVDEVVLGMAVATPGVRGRVSPPPQAATGRVSAAQTEEFRRLQARVSALYGGRDRAWWARRYAQAKAGGEPLRVLIPTSRYSTYIQHASTDLAAAFEALGCEARVVMEASAYSKPSAVGHLRPIAEFEPDLVALINYFRGDAGLPYPEQVPWLCWIQDAMPHQFTERRWGELDFIAGHVHKELREGAAFPASRALPFPVVASTRKFHDGPIDPDLESRFACEVAYVSHQSETPSAFHERCKAEAGDPGAARLLDALRPEVEREAADPMWGTLMGRLNRVCGEVTTRLGMEGSGYVFRHYALPLADKVVRHQTLTWAMGLCERRGWRLRVFGRGWQDHPDLAPYACGELGHGEELRACYRSAAVHLHASVTALVHQRVMECALSGGLALGRLTFDAISESTGWAKREALLHAEPVARDPAKGLCFRVADCPALDEILKVRRSFGEETPSELWITPAQAASLTRPDHRAAQGLHPAWLYGGLDGLVFRSPEDLEKLVTRAVEEKPWREAASAEMAARVRERCTVEAFAAEALRLIGASLAGDASRGSTRAA